METFGFFQLPFATTTEPSATSAVSESQKPQPSHNTQRPAKGQSHHQSISPDDIAEMAHNPVCWMMP